MHVNPLMRLGLAVCDDEVASHDGSAVCCVGMWNRGVWAVEKLVVSCVCVNCGVGVDVQHELS